MQASHCPEFDSRWTHKYENVHIRVWLWKHRAIYEAIFTHRVIVGCIFQASAATSWAKAKSLACKKNWPKSSRRLIFVLTSCVHFALREAIVMASYQIVTSSLFLRMIIGGIGHFSTYEDNTKLPDCLTKASRLRDTLETSSCSHRIIIRWYRDGIMMLVKTTKF